MDVHSTLGTLFVIAVVAVLAPVCLALLPGPRIPQVVLLLLGGMLIGPQGLGLGSPENVQILADVGLGFLFLLAGYEVDQRLLRADAGRRAALSWLVTAALAGGVVGLLYAVGLVRAFVPVAIALTTTALGTLRRSCARTTCWRLLGAHLLAAGAVGELLPIVAVAVFLGTTNRWVALISLRAVTAVAFGLTFLSRRSVGGSAFIEEGEHETTQVTSGAPSCCCPARPSPSSSTSTRCSGVPGRHGAAPLGGPRPAGVGGQARRARLRVLHPDLLRVLGDDDGPGRWSPAAGAAVHRADAAGARRARSCSTACRPRERWQLALITSTALPLLVAISEIGLRNGTMLPANAAALVGAGVLTVLVFPAVAVVLRRPPIVSDAPVP